MSAKKIVEFQDFSFIPEVGKPAYLVGVKGHYRLGDVDSVITSYVISVGDCNNTIETKNTIYKKVKSGDTIEK